MQLDNLAKEMFGNEENFARGLALLVRYRDVKGYSFEDAQTEFFDTLDDATASDTELLLTAMKYSEVKAENAVQSGQYESIDIQRLALEITRQQLTIGLEPLDLTDAFEKFITAQAVNWKASGDSEINYRQDIFPLVRGLFEENLRTTELTVHKVNEYKELVLKLPKNRNKIAKYKGLSVHQLVEIEVPEEDRINNTTKKKYLGKFAAFLKWLGQNQYAVKGLDSNLSDVVKSGVRAYEQRSKFTDDDLKKIFGSPQYVRGRFNEAYKFWVPLIAVLSGARLNEICQLSVSDVYQHNETKIWVFDINEDVPLKSLKRPYHRRFVPIHSRLISLGLLEFVQKVSALGQERVFEELKYHRLHKYGNQVGRWFNRTYTNSANCDVQTPKTSFHSFRHTVINYLSAKLEINENSYVYMLGQTPSGGEAAIRYVKPRELRQYHDYIERITYKDLIDFEAICHWTKHKFGKRLLSRQK